MSASNKGPGIDSRLQNLTNALYVDGNNDIVVRTGFAGNIVISGNVNVPGDVTVNSSPENPNHVHLSEVGTSGILNVPWLPVAGNVRLDAGTNSIGNVRITDGSVTVTNFPAFPSNVSITSLPGITGHVTVDNFPAFPSNVNITSLPGVAVTNFPGNVSITALPSITGNVGVSGNVDVTRMPAITGNVSITQMPGVTGNVGVSGNVSITQMPGVAITSMPEVEIKNDSGNPIPVTGNVTATITDVITVIAEEDPGELYAFNNHAAAANRGWTMDNTMRPVVSFQNGSASAADIIKIVEYEIGNNNANQSTIVYEWYEGPLTISGAAIPAWTTFGVHSQYRVYQDKYSSNQGNTFTVPAGTYQRHSGIIIGKNTSGDEGPANLRGGGSPNMLTLCMRRVDNATKLDVWFAFTVKELT